MGCLNIVGLSHREFPPVVWPAGPIRLVCIQLARQRRIGPLLIRERRSLREVPFNVMHPGRYL